MFETTTLTLYIKNAPFILFNDDITIPKITLRHTYNDYQKEIAVLLNDHQWVWVEPVPAGVLVGQLLMEIIRIGVYFKVC